MKNQLFATHSHSLTLHVHILMLCIGGGKQNNANYYMKHCAIYIYFEDVHLKAEKIYVMKYSVDEDLRIIHGIEEMLISICAD